MTAERIPEQDAVGAYLAEIGKIPLLAAEEEAELARAIEAGLFASKLREARGGVNLSDIDPEITPELLAQYSSVSDEELEEIAHQGGEAKQQFLAANTRLVVSIAKRYRNGVPLLDNISEGNIGLVRAVEKFDYTKGYKFSTYATWWIRQAIGRGAADSAWTIRLPVHRTEKINKLFAVERRLQRERQSDPTPEELAEDLDFSVEEVLALKEDARRTLSLHSPVGTSEERRTEIGDMLVHDERGHDPENTATMKRLRQNLDKVLAALNDAEREVIERRFGLGDGQRSKLADIGKELGVTGERVRQIERVALGKLREHSSELVDLFAGYGGEVYEHRDKFE